jgi:hypothetical protein
VAQEITCHRVTARWGFLYFYVKSTTTPHHDASFLRTGLVRGIAAALVAAGCLTACDQATEHQGSNRALEDELDDEDLTDEEIDALIAEEEAEEDLEDLEDGEPLFDASDDLVSVSDPTEIGELACATSSLANANNGATVAMSVAPNCGYAWDGSTSPNTSYDAPGCPHQYITEVTGTYGKPLSFYWDWQGASLTQTNCELAHANLSAYGATLSFPAGLTWSKIGTSSMHGTWVTTPWFSYCGWAYDPGSGPLPALGNHYYTKVRTAVQATGFIFKQQVEGGVTHGNGPC